MTTIPTLDGLDTAQLGHITNGCGGGTFDVPDWIFHDACQQHDLDYWIGCTEEDRAVADKNFYAAMKTAVSKISWYKRWFYYGMAYTYYRSVRLFTKKYFYYGPTKRTYAELAVEMGVVIEAPQAPEEKLSPEEQPSSPADDGQVVS
jgi:hypothetical protein